MTRAARGFAATGVAVVLLVLGGAFFGAASAFAQTTQIHGSGLSSRITCGPNGDMSVAWSIRDSGALAETYAVTGHQPGASSVSAGSGSVPAGGSAAIEQQGFEASATRASLSVRVTSETTGYPRVESSSVDLGDVCRPPPAAAHGAVTPSWADGRCAGDIPPSVTIPSDAGVTYRLDGTQTSSGVHPVSSGTHLVTESSSTEQLTGRTTFTFHLHSPAGCEKTTVVPQRPQLGFVACSAGANQHARLILADTLGVTYTAAPTGPYRSGSRVTVTAIAGHNDRFAGSPSAGWRLVTDRLETITLSIPSAPACTTVTAVAPTFDNDVCVNYAPTSPTYTIPDVPGVDYTVAGVRMAPGTHTGRDGRQVRVVAHAQVGYVLTGPSGFTHDFPATPVCTTTVTAAPVTFAAARCSTTRHTIAPTFSVPRTPGVEYVVGGRILPAASYPAEPGTTVTATAKVLPGYRSFGTTIWTHTYPRHTSCLTVITAKPVRFVDDTCTSGGPSHADYVIPAATGVQYRVAGQAEHAGVHVARDSSTIVVTARPRPGYRLVGRRRWRHSFAAHPAHCHRPTGRINHGGSSGESHPESGPTGSHASSGLAATGAPLRTALLTGVAILLLGTAAQVCGLGTAPAAGRTAGRRVRHTRR